MKTPYRTAPLATPGNPPGLPFIIGNEAAERFSFYGMRAILVVFMTGHLMAAGGPAPMDEAEAKGWFHLFVAAVYVTPLLGALVSDGLAGKYRTIIALSLVYCLGHLALAVDHTRLGLALGLGLIALGAGGIKPCVSAHLGDQFGRTNAHRLPAAFGWFYFAVNLGAFVSTLATPWLLAHRGPSVAFAVPGVLMGIATGVFWAGRRRFAHVPPGGRAFVRDALKGEGPRALGRLAGIYACVAVFWSLFDQIGSAWVLQAEHLDGRVFGVTILPAQMQAANPLLVMVLIPLFAYRVYPALGRRMDLTPLRRIAIGMFVAAAAFAVPTALQAAVDAGARPGILWQLVAYVLLTAAEVMVSITCLELSYTQAPPRLKSLVMAFFMLSIAAGNLFTSGVNFLIRRPDGTARLAGADYFLFFTLLMLVTAVGFTWVARRFRGETHLHPQVPPGVPSGPAPGGASGDAGRGEVP
jgi:POT family proton-dependent oligopeptide transporter